MWSSGTCHCLAASLTPSSAAARQCASSGRAVLGWPDGVVVARVSALPVWFGWRSGIPETSARLLLHLSAIPTGLPFRSQGRKTKSHRKGGRVRTVLAASVPNEHAPLWPHSDLYGRTLFRCRLARDGRWSVGRPCCAQQCLNPAAVEGLAHVAIHLQERAVIGSGERADFNATTNHAQQLNVGLSIGKLAPALAKGDLVGVGLSGLQGSIRC